MGESKIHKRRPMNSGGAEQRQAGTSRGPAMSASHSITPRCCPPCLSTAVFTPAQASPCDNLSAGPNLSKALIRKTGPSENSPKPWIRVGRAAHPTHKTRQGPVIQVTASSVPARSERRKAFLYFTLRGMWFCRRAKGGPSIQVAVKGSGGCSAACRNWPRIGYTPSYLRKNLASQSSLPLSCAFVFSRR